MKIELKKFGTMLISRQSGREAFSAFLPSFKDVSVNEMIEIDFTGVVTFSPSWGDEFLSKLLEKFGDRLILLKSNNPSVLATLEILEQANGKKFKV
ncbi:MAG: hypothetical protein A2541_02395 [Candidatus Taylorbacteria bacterium RIFOXYD2_FULL_36_9]|uniref:DUF4325 domain-containing protein n=1 Tax=Candidatus Taylorbacteria bacterium RIFOXYD2_FULL_36_9 TaxID=1802338 RepID=A0A1G2PGJ9_9BACT|nr:MAG: hypothetical protein A2541_02395 [Candidatus Taylorbacteria bacterium RIFOXYD2_FULL_36_9]